MSATPQVFAGLSAILPGSGLNSPRSLPRRIRSKSTICAFRSPDVQTSMVPPRDKSRAVATRPNAKSRRTGQYGMFNYLGHVPMYRDLITMYQRRLTILTLTCRDLPYRISPAIRLGFRRATLAGAAEANHDPHIRRAHTGQTLFLHQTFYGSTALCVGSQYQNVLKAHQTFNCLHSRRNCITMDTTYVRSYGRHLMINNEGMMGQS